MTIPARSGDIMLVEVPESARDIRIGITTGDLYYNDVVAQFIELPKIKKKERWTILGTITAGVPDFEVEGLLEKYEDGAYPNYDYIAEQGKDYEGDDWGTMDKSDSFRSLLLSKSVDITKKWVAIKKEMKI